MASAGQGKGTSPESRASRDARRPATAPPSVAATGEDASARATAQQAFQKQPAQGLVIREHQGTPDEFPGQTVFPQGGQHGPALPAQVRAVGIGAAGVLRVGRMGFHAQTMRLSPAGNKRHFRDKSPRPVNKSAGKRNPNAMRHG